MIVDHYHILNTNAEFAVFVVPRLVGNAHPDFKFNCASAGDALWTFVDTIEGAYSMASSMLVINTSSPKMSSS